MKNLYFANRILSVLTFCLIITNQLIAQTNNYFGTSGALSGAVWSTTPEGPYTNPLVETGGVVLNFNNVTSSVTGSAILNLNAINVNANTTISTPTTDLIKNTTIAPVFVNDGVTFDCSTQIFTNSTTGGYIKNGNGVWAMGGGVYRGGFTLNAGTLVARTINAMGGNGPLNINGGTIASVTHRLFTNKFTLITIGGDFTLGATTGLALSSANLTFNAPVNLGSLTHTLTIGGTGIYSFDGIISGTAGLTLNSTAKGILLFTNSANTYSGTTTINTGAELKLNPSATPASFASQIALNGGQLTTTGIALNSVINNSSTLKLDDDSKIILGDNPHSLIFADSHLINWTQGKKLTIYGWLGEIQTSGTSAKIFVGNGGLTSDQLGQIKFFGFADGAQILSTGELVPASNPTLSAAAYQHFIMYGQSLSVGFQSYPSLSTDIIPGNYMIGDQVWINLGNTNFVEFKPLYSTLSINDTKLALSRALGMGECSITSVVNHLQKKSNAVQNIIASSCGTGGKSIEELSKESQTTILYKDFTKTINSAATIAWNSNNSITCPAIIWMQGEWNYKGVGSGLTVGSTPTANKASYKSLLLSLKNNMQGDIMIKYGQIEKPLFISYQVGAQYTIGTDLPIGMAQLEASNENEDVVCAGPVYPATDRGGHLDPNGYRWYGEMIAKAYYKTKIEKVKFRPLQPSLIARTTDPNTIKIQFLVPKLPLVLDIQTLAKVQDYGFSLYNDGIKMTLSNVSVLGDCVYLTSTVSLTGLVEVTYAGVNSGILNGQGNLRDNDDYKAFYNYIDLDKKKGDGTYFYPRDSAETTLRPTFEPKDSTGTIIYDKPYPLYNFCVAFYYKLQVGEQSYAVPNLASTLTNSESKLKSAPELNVYQMGGSLIVKTDNQELTSLKLYDLLGNIVRVYNVQDEVYSVDKLPKGLYLIEVKSRNSTKSIKIKIN